MLGSETAQSDFNFHSCNIQNLATFSSRAIAFTQLRTNLDFGFTIGATEDCSKSKTVLYFQDSKISKNIGSLFSMLQLNLRFLIFSENQRWLNVKKFELSVQKWQDILTVQSIKLEKYVYLVYLSVNVKFLWQKCQIAKLGCHKLLSLLRQQRLQF